MDSQMEVIDIREMAMKWRSKHEIYVMLTTLGHYYLLDECDWNNDYIADVLQGRKK